MTSSDIDRIIAEGRCPAEVARELGYDVVVDCENSGYDCHTCLANVTERDRYRQ